MNGSFEPGDIQINWDGLMPPSGLAASQIELDAHTDAGALRLAKDSNNAVHLLVPVSEGVRIPTDRSSRGVVLIEQAVVLDGDHVCHADLVCSDERLQPVFSQLVADVIRRIADDPSHSVDQIVRALQEWRELFQRIRRSEDSKALGLTGELEILRNLADRNPSAALEAWSGPTGAVHDFVSGPERLEVKTSARRDGYAVSIHGLDQLDPGAQSRLHLVFVRVAPDPLVGLTVPDRVDQLVEMHVPRADLLDRLSQVGYKDDEREAWEQKFAVTEVSIWKVFDSFPGLRRSRLSPDHLLGIEGVAYELDLAAAGSPLGVAERLQVWDRLAGVLP